MSQVDVCTAWKSRLAGFSKGRLVACLSAVRTASGRGFLARDSKNELRLPAMQRLVRSLAWQVERKPASSASKEGAT